MTISSIVWIFLGAVVLFLLKDYIWILVLVGIASFAIACFVNRSRQAEKDETQRQNAQRPPSPLLYQKPSGTTYAPTVYVPPIIDGCPMVYRYMNIAISDVNRTYMLMALEYKDLMLTPVKHKSGAILLKWRDHFVASLTERAEMCDDWIRHGDPIRCVLKQLKEGEDKVALFFYRDQESYLKERCTVDIVKLTACIAPDKQEAIDLLEDGEKLFIEYDDDNRPYIRTISYAPIGRLPKKFDEIIDDDLIDGIFFDHSEIEKNDDWEKEDKQIPFVRVYTTK